GKTDRARVVVDRASDGLTDPPRAVGRELVTAAPVELLDTADQSEHAFLDQVEEGQPAPLVSLRDRDDEAQVRTDHLVARFEVALLDQLREPDLLVRGEQGVA